MYDADVPESLARLAERANPGVTVDRAELETRLFDLFQAVGLPVDDSEAARLWREMASQDKDSKALRRIFERMAMAPNPLAAEVCPSEARAWLNARARNRWSRRELREQRPTSLLGLTWDQLSDEARTDVRRMAWELARFHNSRVDRGAPRKFDQDTLMLGLAEIVLELAKLDHGRSDLPYTMASWFIRFCHLALRPFFALTEVTPAALSRRWKRLKDEDAAGEY